MVKKEMNPEEQATQMSYKPKERKVKPEILEFEARIFELESANEHFLTIQDEVQSVINQNKHELFLDIVRQLKRNRKKDIFLDYQFQNDLVRKLTKIFEKGYNRGKTDVKKEINKLKQKPIEMAIEDSGEIKSNISKLIKKFYVDIKTKVETRMNKVSDKYIENKGGLESYILEMEEGFKYDERMVIQEVEASYTNGRGDLMQMWKDNIETYLYSAVVDKNLCNVCAPFDGNIYTLEELQEAGLQLTHPVNPDCLGRDNDRCMIIPYSLGG